MPRSDDAVLNLLLHELRKGDLEPLIRNQVHTRRPKLVKQLCVVRVGRVLEVMGKHANE